MCLAYRAYFSLPICLFAFQLLCVAEKYPLSKPKDFRKIGKIKIEFNTNNFSDYGKNDR